MLASAALAVLVSIQGHPAHGIRPPTGRLLLVGGPGGIPTIQAAVDEAGDGDSILVRSGAYSGFSIVDKGIYLTADAEALVVVEGSVLVRDLGPGKSTLLAGLVIHGATDGAALDATNDAGGLRVEGCTMVGADAHYVGSLQWTPPQQGVLLDGDANVALVMCTMSGGLGRPGDYDVPTMNGGPGATALEVHASSVAVQDSAITGGTAGQGFEDHSIGGGGTGGLGGTGVALAGGFLYASGCDITGGAGGAGGDHLDTMCGFSGGPGIGGPGGVAVQVTGAGSSPIGFLLGNTVTGGAGGRGGYDRSDFNGYPCWGDGPPGAAGPTFDAPAGALEMLAGDARRMITPRVARGGTTVTVRAYGEPGDFVQVFAAGATDFIYAPQFNGVQLLRMQKSILLASGTIPANGSLPLQIPFTDPPKDARPQFLQGYFRDATNQRFAATQSTILVVDPRY